MAESVFISTIGSLSVLLLGWLAWGQWRLADRVEKLAEQKLDQSICAACGDRQHSELHALWHRVNHHKHTPDGGVVIE